MEEVTSRWINQSRAGGRGRGAGEGEPLIKSTPNQTHLAFFFSSFFFFPPLHLTA